MGRYYSDSDNDNGNGRQHFDKIEASGWQSPSSSSSSITRIVVEAPFGSKKYDYTIDKSQQGRLVVTAHRRRLKKSDYRSKNHIAIQTFTIPYDADVDNLQSYIERSTNRLIIEIPRRKHMHTRTSRSSYASTDHINTRLLRSPDIEHMLTTPTGGPQLVHGDTRLNRKSSSTTRKLEYHVDCRGYAADELEVFIQGRDLVVQGQTKTSKSPDPTHQHVSKKFSRRITLPHTVDLPKVVSYLENGELRIEAPLKYGVYHNQEEIIVPGPPPSSTSLLSLNHPVSTLISNYENRIRSPSPNDRRYYYRQNERPSRRRDYDRSKNRHASNTAQHVRSSETLRYPLYKSAREVDDDEENQRRRVADNERSTTDQQTIHRTVYSPTRNASTNTPIHQSHGYLSDDDKYLRF